MVFPKNLAKGAKMAAAWNNYLAYLQSVDDQQPNVGNGAAKPPQKELYVWPFSFDIEETTQRVAKNGTESLWGTYGTYMSNYTDATWAPANAIILRPKSFQPARVVIRILTSTNGVVKTSAKTKLKYLQYPGKAGSLPYGRNVAGDNEADVFSTIRTAIYAGISNDANVKISRSREKS